MFNWVSIEGITAALLATTYSCVGVLALWVATSPRHWFVRSATILALFALLLAVPAYEAIVVFSLQSLVIVTGAIIYRKSWPRLRYSLLTFLLAVVLVAVTVLIVNRLPPLNNTGWLTLVLHGISAGLATLIAALWCSGARKRLSLPIGIAACAVLGAILSMFDWFIPSVTSWTGWPPEPTPTPLLPGFGDAERPIVVWFFVPISIVVLTALVAYSWTIVTKPLDAAAVESIALRSPRKRRIAGALSAILIALVGALPAYVLAKLLTPDPIPLSSLPTPNGYDDFVTACKISNSTQFDGTLDFQTATTAQLTTEVMKCAEAYKLVDAGLSKVCVAPVKYTESSDPLPMDEISIFRSFARAQLAKGKVVESNGQFAEASRCYVEGIRFGYANRKGGLLIHALVGIGCSSFGISPLYHVRDKLSDDELQECIQPLIRADANDDTFADVWQRDRVWSQRNAGWHGHLQQILAELIAWKYDLLFMNSEDYPIVYWKNQAVVRLLICELAIERYRKSTGRCPKSLNDLMPDYLPAVPIDPLDPDARPLRYRLDGNTCLVYSVGPNRVDDGGIAPEKSDLMGLSQTGDLRLDDYVKEVDEVDADTAEVDSSAEPSDAETSEAGNPSP